MSETEHDPEDIRARISADYAAAVRKASEGGCCGGGDPLGAVAPLAGYRPEDVGELPGGVPPTSFGCGNPLAFSDVEEGQVVLDLGSGAGLDLLIAARKVGPTGRVIGVDMTDDMIERARANARAAGVGNVEVRKGLIERLPVDDASIDWVVSNCVINLSPQKERVFAEIARVLRPGGRLRISDIVAESLSDEARANATLVSCCLGGAVPEAAYVAGLERAGLVDVEVLERIRYDGEQLAALAGHGSPDASSCCGDLPSSGDAPTLARSLEGKVWSAVFAARRP